jgi:hypothetical protein
MPGQFFDNFVTKIPPEKLHDIRNSMRHLAKTMFQVGNSLRDKYSEQALNEALRVIDETSQKLEDIDKKLKGEKP